MKGTVQYRIAQSDYDDKRRAYLEAQAQARVGDELVKALGFSPHEGSRKSVVEIVRTQRVIREVMKPPVDEVTFTIYISDIVTQKSEER